jgi:hypothetical protein
MQLVPKYLLNNSVSLIANLAGEVTEYRPVYTRNINVVRGIDSTIQFNVLNADQKPVSILNTYTPKFKLFDENNRLIVERDGTIIETATTKKGHFTVTISENDLLNVLSQYLSYTIFLQNDSTNEKIILHSGTNFNNRGTIQVQAEEFPGPLDSVSVSTFTEDNPSSGIFISSTVDAQPAINGNSALHTAAYYLESAVGDIIIQGTLDTNAGTSNWSDIDTFTATSTDTLVYRNFNGVFSHLRFKHTLTSGSVTKILVRN